jgi:plastocyanin domain-containing protein
MRTSLLALASTLAVSLPSFAADPKPEPTKAEPQKAGKGPRELAIKVTEDGYVPEKLTVKKGEPVRLVVTRVTDATCATELLIEGTSIKTKLPLNKAVNIDWTPTKSGSVKYGCAMGMMVSGVLLVE